MLNAARHRMHKDEEEGFTLIELLVVVLILGILMAIAIPTFLSLTGTAKKNAAEANLTTAVQDAATQFTQNGTYGGTTSGADVTALTAVDPGIPYIAATPTTGVSTAAGKQVSVNAGSTNAIVILSSVSSDNTAWYWANISSGAVTYASSTTSAQPTTFPLSSLP